MNDVRVAEELAVRFADARWSYGAPKYDEMYACRERMFEAAASTHGVSVDDVARAGEQLGANRLEWPVHGPLTVLALLMAFACARWLQWRLGRDERAAFVFAAFVLSIAAGVALLLVGTLWAGVVEMLRVGNQHLAFRGTRLPWHQQYVEVFVTSLAIFWAVVAFTSARSRLKAAPTYDLPPEGGSHTLPR
jgi:hypothetical protein